MSSRNATASWSGYAHQGKIGLLIALRKIHKEKSIGLSAFSIEQETSEDVCLKSGVTILELHQVKAYMSTAELSAYKKALKTFEKGASINYLHSVRPINDWSTLTATENPKSVIRYLYSPTMDYCPLNQIDDLILAEISLVLQQSGSSNYDNPGFCKQGYQEYQTLLDQRIREEHRTGTKATYSVRIGLDEILKLIQNPPAHAQSVTCGIRKVIYNEYVNFVKDLEEAAYPAMSKSHEDMVSGTIETFCKLDDDDLEEFLFQIFPSSSKGKRLASCELTDEFFVAKDFATTFLHTLISIDRVTAIVEGGTYPHYKVDKNYLITALQELPSRLMAVSKNILDNDRLNTARYEADYIINEHFEGKLSGHAARSIPRDTGILAQNELEFITRAAAILKLNTP